MQKYGGSSVADAAGILRAARRIAETRAAGNRVVAVVSAMGDTTDDLLDLADAISTRPHPRSLDALIATGELVSIAALALALTDLGEDVTTFTGSEAGLITDNLHGRARILDVRPGRITTCLERGGIAVVAGFQGRTGRKKSLTTLGRGGSDLTAVALAAALGASICEIYTDVDGVYTADPRVVPTARKIDVISSEEMLEFAASGAKILHLRCVEYARRFGVPIHVRSSFAQHRGTLILPSFDRQPGEPAREQPVISEVIGVNSSARITVFGVSEGSDTTARIVHDLTGSGLNLEMIIKSSRSAGSGRTDISFTIPAAEASTAMKALESARTDITFQGIDINEHVGRVSVVGLGMRSSPHVFSTFFRALSDAGIHMELVEISEICIAAVTRAGQLDAAVGAVRRAFGLARVAKDVSVEAPPGIQIQAAPENGALDETRTPTA
ncbi:aspartate kinase [Arthrobacter crusticola]|uniref:aspartate kinase n=1 Tax=Arthrobacter crusticola TaxID=2547960 RepID=UPI001FE7E50F|nr:aspartate kinase [Arthrobacter crusticola]